MRELILGKTLGKTTLTTMVISTVAMGPVVMATMGVVMEQWQFQLLGYPFRIHPPPPGFLGENGKKVRGPKIRRPRPEPLFYRWVTLWSWGRPLSLVHLYNGHPMLLCTYFAQLWGWREMSTLDVLVRRMILHSDPILAHILLNLSTPRQPQET